MHGGVTFSDFMRPDNNALPKSLPFFLTVNILRIRKDGETHAVKEKLLQEQKWFSDNDKTQKLSQVSLKAIFCSILSARCQDCMQNSMRRCEPLIQVL